MKDNRTWNVHVPNHKIIVKIQNSIFLSTLTKQHNLQVLVKLRFVHRTFNHFQILLSERKFCYLTYSKFEQYFPMILNLICIIWFWMSDTFICYTDGISYCIKNIPQISAKWKINFFSLKKQKNIFWQRINQSIWKFFSNNVVYCGKKSYISVANKIMILNIS